MTLLENRTDLTPLELFRLLDAGTTPFVLLDVRNDEEFAAWKIEGRHAPVATVHVPYFDFLEDEDAAVAALAAHKDLPIVVVCAKGGSSDFVAGVLRDRGFTAANLAEGMIGWGDLLVEHDVPTGLAHGWADAAEPRDGRERRTGLVVKQLQRVGKGCLAYLIADGGKAIVVDPHRHVEPYMALAARMGVTITHVFDTHLHADHISGGRLLADRTGATYLIEAHDAEGAKFEFQAVRPGETLTLGATEIVLMPLYTPGHTPGSASMLIDGRFLVSGDTLFVASIGRPDLGGKMDEWGRMLFHTLKGQVARLGDEVLILPAHYAGLDEVRPDGLVAGTLGELRRTNEALKLETEADFIAFLERNKSEAPTVYQDIRKVNLRWLDVDDAKATEMDLGKNQCAASQAKASHA